MFFQANETFLPGVPSPAGGRDAGNGGPWALSHRSGPAREEVGMEGACGPAWEAGGGRAFLLRVGGPGVSGRYPCAGI